MVPCHYFQHVLFCSSRDNKGGKISDMSRDNNMFNKTATSILYCGTTGHLGKICNGVIWISLVFDKEYLSQSWLVL